MDQEKLRQLSAKISDGTASDEEIAWYHRYCLAAEQAAKASGANIPDDEDTRAEMYRQIRGRIKGKKARLPLKYRYAAAAALTGALAATAFLYRPATHKSQPAVVAAASQNIPAGGNKAVLTLANGKEIMLSDAGAGDIVKQAGLRIYKTSAGEIVYEATATGNVSDTGINRITTPRGGQYSVVLPDGSKVWLNAASSLSYPVNFSARERRVMLQGEAYFEIARNAGRAFKVVTATQTVEVLGTHFNVDAYSDNAMVRTTLLEGSVKVVTAPGTQLMLKPGEQARFNNQTGALQKSNVSEEDVIAWKNGYFIFNDTWLTDVLLQLSRWYDVQVDQATIPRIRYSGSIPRQKTLQEVLAMLEFTGNRHFEIVNRTIKVK